MLQMNMLVTCSMTYLRIFKHYILIKASRLPPIFGEMCMICAQFRDNKTPAKCRLLMWVYHASVANSNVANMSLKRLTLQL